VNRRQLMQAITSACSAAGIPHLGEFAVYGGEREPTLAVIHSSRSLPPDAVESIRKCWDDLRNKCPKLPPCVVLDAGLRLEMFETVSPERQ
jgi:hypothetical protein